MGRITAAAVTGPARQPRPASSVPVSSRKAEKLGSSILGYIRRANIGFFFGIPLIYYKSSALKIIRTNHR
jgi:hypothetical protein